MLSRNQLHTHAHRYGHVHGNGYGGDLVGYVVRNATVGPPKRRCATVHLFISAMSNCIWMSCNLIRTVAWRCGWAGWDQLSTHGGRSVNCCIMTKMTLTMSRLQLDLCIFAASSLGSWLLIELWDVSVEGTRPFEWPNLREKGNELLGIHSADSGSP